MNSRLIVKELVQKVIEQEEKTYTIKYMQYGMTWSTEIKAPDGHQASYKFQATNPEAEIVDIKVVSQEAHRPEDVEYEQGYNDGFDAIGPKSSSYDYMIGYSDGRNDSGTAGFNPDVMKARPRS